jgi:hypothetical protein
MPFVNISLEAPAEKSIDRLCRYVEARGFRGYDPYDALNSPILAFLSRRSKYARIAFMQALRRLPVNVRPLLGIRPAQNAKALGLFLNAYAELFRLTSEDRYRWVASTLVDMLLGMITPGFSGPCWGYHFPWQSRTFYLPAGTPTAVCTCFVADGLLEWYEATGDARGIDLARGACNFLLRDLNAMDNDAGVCYSYSPLDRTRVYNANTLAGALLARVGALTGEPKLTEAAARCAAYVVARQREDGSWVYGEAPCQRWIDSFHTGFVLDGLARIVQDAGFDQGAAPLERGRSYFLRTFFEPDGAVRYYHDSLRPIDIHCPTQALVTLAGMPRSAERDDLMERVAAWMLRNMRAPGGYFYFRLGRTGRPNRIPYMRWGQAWALRALAAVTAGLGSEASGPTVPNATGASLERTWAG